MSFEGLVKDVAVGPTLTMKSTWKPWDHTQEGQMGKRVGRLLFQIMTL